MKNIDFSLLEIVCLYMIEKTNKIVFFYAKIKMVIYMKKKRILFILAFITIVLLSLFLCNKELQNDTFYTIKVGEFISKHGIDFMDHYSFIPNLRYTYPHWLFDLSIFHIYNLFGFKGLFATNIILIFSLLSLLFTFTYKITKDFSISYYLLLALTLFFGGFVAIRAQLVSYILLLVILYSIEMLRETGKKRYILISFVSSVLISNIHGAVFYMIMILFLPYLVSDLLYIASDLLNLNNFKNSILYIEKPKNTKLLFIMLGVCILSGLLSVGNTSFTYLPLSIMGNSTNYILEHAAPSIKMNAPLFAFIGLFVLLLLIPKIKIRLHDFFMIAGLLVMSLLSLRSFSLFLLFSSFAFGRILTDLYHSKLKNVNFDDILSKKYIYIPAIVLLAMLSLITFYRKAKTEYVNHKEYPEEIVEYIHNNYSDKEFRSYNEYGIGAYMLFKDVKVFIDSRCDLYTPEFNKGITVFDDAMNMSKKFKEYEKKYNFTHFLVKRNTPLSSILDVSSDYEVEKEDEYFILYKKVFYTST